MTARPDADVPLRPWPAPLAVAVFGCLFAVTGALLGADWLKAGVLLLPAGLWMVILATTLTWWMRRRSAALPAAVSAAMPALNTPVLPIIAPVLARLIACAERAARWLNVDDERISYVRMRLASMLDGADVPERPFRIGLDVSTDQKLAIMSHAHEASVTWVMVPAGMDDEHDCRAHDLDALVRQPPTGDAYIVTRTDSQREAAWYDWSSPRPLTYASVFPGCVDPERITLADVDWKDADQVILVGRALEAAAVLARLPHRLDVADRLLGRRPVDAERIQRAMLSLAGSLASIEPPASAFERGLARAMGAYFCTDAAPCDTETRTRMVELAARLLADEAESTLRLAAVRFGVLDDDPALSLLLAAHDELRTGAYRFDVDHIAFLQSEVEHGLPAPLTVGRVAAGICLVCASAPDDQFELLRDDILDDLRFSGWLIGRDDDHALLIEVFRTLWRARSGPAMAA